MSETKTKKKKKKGVTTIWESHVLISQASDECVSEGAVVDITKEYCSMCTRAGSMGDVGKREAILSKSVYLGWPWARKKIGLGTLCLRQMVNARLVSLRTQSHWSIQ